MMQIRVRVSGEGRIIHRCAVCGAPTDNVEMRDGQPVAVHPEHKESPDGRRSQIDQ